MESPPTTTPSLPTIEQSIQCLKDYLLSSIDQGIVSHSAVKLYLSSMHLLWAIKQEQHHISQYGCKHVKIHGLIPIPFPPSTEIPTIHQILHDPALRHLLFLCLSTSSSHPILPSQLKVKTSDVAAEVSTGISSTATHIVADGSGLGGTRKRSMSLSVETSVAVTTGKQLMAFGTSPKMNVALRGTAMQTNSGSSAVLGSHSSQMNKPMFHAPVLAATILYAVLEYYDHWPTPLIQIYADDCFGPRIWVDHKCCTLLISNLSRSHSHLDENNICSIDVDMAQASVISGAFRDYWTNHQQLPTAASGNVGSSSSWRKNDRSNEPHPKRQRAGPPRTTSSSFHDSESEDDRSNILQLQSSVTSLEHCGDDDSMDDNDAAGPSRDLSCISNKLSEGHETDNDTQSIVAGAPLSTLPDIQNAVGYPVTQQYLRPERVRNRYHGENLKAAHDAIVLSLVKRLDTKSKQNSSLLQCLPSFMEISGVRKLVAARLEKWLQSPALAGLARSLFISTVNHIKIVDPPLSDDLQVIDSIVGMNLKSNQLNAHIDNISAIAKKLPFISVITHVYSSLTKQLMTLSTVNATSDHLKMIAAIHRVVPPTLSYDAIASVLLMLLVNPYGRTVNDAVPDKMDRFVSIQKLRKIVRVLAAVLGAAFDGTIMIQSLLSFKVNPTTWSCDDEEDKARLIFQCGTLAIGSSVNDSRYPDNNSQTMTIRAVLKLMLTYCCTEYGPQFRCKGSLRMIDYFRNGFGKLENESDLPPWLVTMKCLLFLEPPDSTQMKKFILHGSDTVDSLSEWDDELPRIKACYQVGGGVSSDLIWILLKSTSFEPGIDAEMAICLLETLLIRCSEKQPISLDVHDPKIVWELYNLVVFEPKDQMAEGIDRRQLDSREFPRLAFPGLWWRVTMIALVLCSNSPQKIGTIVWREHPTLQAIIKMVTSKRFRFPSVDCDEVEKMNMKKLDYAAREEERRIAETLFLPPKPERKLNVQKGARVSRRIQLQRQEKEATKELAETRRRKALLDEAHKKIMIWDPDGPARKPPPESVDMLHAINERFHLSHQYQRCTDPDFLLMSIGQSTRDAIERAYDWLIPIVSSLPTVISRLPSSASCLLLLRAYSTSGEEKKQLKELSAPLLQHVTDSLGGLYGESDAVKAFDLIMSDMASKKAEKRKCARKVLQDLLLTSETLVLTQSINLFACMIRILELKHANLLVRDAINHMFHAAVLEKSAIIPALVMSLQKHIDFAQTNKIEIQYQFPVLLTHLICSRPLVCMEAMRANVPFFELTIMALHAEYSNYFTVTLSSVDSAVSPIKGGKKVPTQLLQSLCAVLSIWNDQIVTDECKTAVRSIADVLLQDDNEAEATQGLWSEWRSAISLDNWIMLAKARCKNIVRRTVLSIPPKFLPRILLCSGLSQSSVITIIERLGQVVDFNGWIMGPIGNKQYITSNRKLLASIAAYFRIYNISVPTENLFLTKLLNENDSIEAAKDGPKKIKGMGSQIVGMTDYATTFLSELSNVEIYPNDE